MNDLIYIGFTKEQIKELIETLYYSDESPTLQGIIAILKMKIEE